ncbi:MAG: hypothetical protein QOG46_1982 [Pseudonocardiales bacterium]|nr:hypothetical protein [Pseudonocardiales bacterium]
MEPQVRCLHIDHHMVIASRPPANRDTGQSSPTAHARVRAPPPPDEGAAALSHRVRVLPRFECDAKTSPVRLRYSHFLTQERVACNCRAGGVGRVTVCPLGWGPTPEAPIRMPRQYASTLAEAPLEDKSSYSQGIVQVRRVSGGKIAAYSAAGAASVICTFARPPRRSTVDRLRWEQRTQRSSARRSRPSCRVPDRLTGVYGGLS